MKKEEVDALVIKLGKERENALCKALDNSYTVKRILEHRLDIAKRALCEVSRLSLQDNVDTSRFYDIAHYAITELNKEI